MWLIVPPIQHDIKGHLARLRQYESCDLMLHVTALAKLEAQVRVAFGPKLVEVAQYTPMSAASTFNVIPLLCLLQVRLNVESGNPSPTAPPKSPLKQTQLCLRVRTSAWD
eukprot:684617-Amphidinium_carterae.1